MKGIGCSSYKIIKTKTLLEIWYSKGGEGGVWEKILAKNNDGRQTSCEVKHLQTEAVVPILLFSIS